MKISLAILASVATAVLLGVVGPIALANEDPSPPTPATTDGSVQVAEFSIAGMIGPQCPAVAERTLGNLDGVVAVDASYEHRMATVVFDPSKTDPTRISEHLQSGSSLTAELTALRGLPPVSSTTPSSLGGERSRPHASPRRPVRTGAFGREENGKRADRPR